MVFPTIKRPRMPRAFTIIIITILLITCVGSYLSAAFIQRRAEARIEFADQISAMAVQVCESRNVDRASDLDMWLFVVSLDPRTTPVQSRFLEYLNEAKDPIDCTFGSPTFGMDVDPPMIPVDPVTN